MSTTDNSTIAPQAPQQPPKRHRVRNTVLVVSAVGIAAIIGANAAGGSTPTSSSTPAAPNPPAASAPANPAPEASTPAAPAAPAPTVAQEQALESAQGYLEMGSGFSKAGLMEQLTSSAGEGFAEADARWAIRQLHPDWKAQAVMSAKGYLDMGGFSRASLIEQLSSSAGEGFTLAQATYAADQVGL